VRLRPIASNTADSSGAHGVNYNNRMVELDATLTGTTLTIKGPPNANIYPPGPAWLYVIIGGVPSLASKVRCEEQKPTRSNFAPSFLSVDWKGF
jgi:hypothetical protein